MFKRYFEALVGGQFFKKKKNQQAGENESEFLIRLWVVPSKCGGIIRDVSLVALAETDVLLQTRRVQLSCADKSCQVRQSKVDW